MSHRGAAACRSKNLSRERNLGSASVSEGTEYTPADALLVPPKASAVAKRDRRIRKSDGWHETTSARCADVETVADFEKWLRTRSTEPPMPSSMDLDTAKVVEGVDRYLGEEMLSHGCFLGKDPYGLSIDIDLADAKKLNLSSGYDPILPDLTQSENRLLEPPCEKGVDEFMLPEFQLDHLDPLAALSPDDMMVAGEILPSTSAHHATLSVTENQEVERIGSKTEAAEQNNEMDCGKCARVVLDELPADLEAVDEMTNVKLEEEAAAQFSSNPSEFFVATLTPMEEGSSSSIANSVEADVQDAITHQLKSKTRMKLEPRIIKKRRQITEKLENPVNGKSFADVAGQDGVMAVVAISTDKISNTTQIVINTGTEKQIYQGKTSELIEATGNFPKLPKIDTSSAVWNGAVEYGVDNNPSNQYEIVISNALEELGITDDSLQPVRITEHDKVWLCPRDGCNRQFGRLYTLKGHLLAHFGVRPFKCDFQGCTWAFYSEFKLKRHKETHLKRKDYVCEMEGCNRRFTTVYNLWSHMKLHSRPNRIVCQVPDCGEKFQTKRALELHMKSHDQRHAPYVCQHEGCGKRYYSSNALTSHQRSHSYKEVDIKCSWPGCGKIFDKPCRLKAHTRSHTGYKPYSCTFQGCKWAFSSSSKLKRHEKKHTNERKFVCDVPDCGKAFMRSEHLKEHRLTHTEGRYFQCFVCEARFSAKSSLYVHIKKHQQAKTDSAPECAAGGQRRAKTKESQYSRVKPIAKPKAKSAELVKADEVIAKENDVEKLDVNERSQNEEQLKWLYRCPIEMCAHLMNGETSLREHLLKTHGIRCGDSSLEASPSAANDVDYILYTVHGSSSNSSVEEEQQQQQQQMVMVTPCDAVVLGTTSSSSSINRCLPEPEPPPFDAAKNLEPLRNDARVDNRMKEAVPATKRNQRSARTDLTYADWYRLKMNGALMDTIATDTTNLVPDVDAGSDLSEEGEGEEGLLLTEELPSMYYQDDAAGTEYQVLLLDSSPLEIAGNLRGLE